MLMPLEAYPFRAKFGWLEDPPRLSWQLSLASRGAVQAWGRAARRTV